MKTYIGTKIIQAEPMDALTFGLTVRSLPGVVEIDSAGQAEPGYKVIYAGGYVSWSPKDVFEQAYREISPEEKTLLI